MMSTKVKELNLLQNCVNELNTTNSKNDKQDILAKYPSLKNYFLYVHHPYWQYNITSKAIEKRVMHLDKYNSNKPKEYNTIFELLDALKNREITGHNALDAVDHWIGMNCEELRPLLYKIIDKNLEVRMSEKSINKAWPKLIPTFDVALATKYEDHIHKIKDYSKYMISKKLDGVRCIIRCEGTGNIKCYSRKGKEINTLSKIVDELKKYNIRDCVLDGEICIIDSSGKEDFTSIVSQIRKKDYTIDNPIFVMFDKLTLKEFDDKIGTRKLKDRYMDYGIWASNYKFKFIQPLIQIRCASKKALNEQMDNAVKNKWEGLMLRKDIGYEGKRSRHLLKMKKFHDAEYKVVGTEVGPFRVINKESGLEETIETMTNVNIYHKNSLVSVGSGFSLEQRELYYNNPEQIIDHTITVQYFEESCNKDGKLSLRFPTVKHIYDKNGRRV